MQPPYIEEVIIALMVICAFLFTLITLVYLANMGRDFDNEPPVKILGYEPDVNGFRISFICFLLSVVLWMLYLVLF